MATYNHLSVYHKNKMFVSSACLGLVLGGGKVCACRSGPESRGWRDRAGGELQLVQVHLDDRQEGAAVWGLSQDDAGFSFGLIFFFFFCSRQLLSLPACYHCR